MDRIFGHPDISVSAVWIAAGTSEERPIRLIRHGPDWITESRIDKAVTGALREAAADLKTAWRGQIKGAGLGRRLVNSIRNATYPKAGDSLNATALVWSKAPVIVGAHNAGSLIRSRDGFWLAIPTEAAGKLLRGGRITPGEWERRTGLRLRFVYRGRGPSLLVAEGRLNTKGRAVASRSKTGRGCGRGSPRAGLSACATGEAPKTPGSGAGCGTGGGWGPGRIVGKWVEGRILPKMLKP